jgi:hypothetical protein
MANHLSLEKKAQAINGLAEGLSIRSVERMTGIHRDTIMRLGIRVGNGCAALMNRAMRNLSCRRVQVDEIWGYIAKKQGHLTKEDNEAAKGDFYTFVALERRVGNISTSGKLIGAMQNWRIVSMAWPMKAQGLQTKVGNSMR